MAGELQFQSRSPSLTPAGLSDEYKVNGELTIGENIGDLGGIMIAWKAYLLSLNGAEPPVIDGRTGAERFLLSWGQIWRGKSREAIAIQRLATDPHSPSEFRCNQITIASPEAGVLTVLDLGGTRMRAVATSGSAERGNHIWNPKNPDAAQTELVQVTVIADDLVRADVWATAAFAEGPRAVERLNREADLEALFVFADGQIHAEAVVRLRFLKSPKGIPTPDEVLEIMGGWDDPRPELPEWIHEW